MKKIILTLIASSFILAGCAGTKEVEIKSSPVNVQIDHPNPPRQVIMRDVKWTVLNRERLEQLLEENEGNFALFALTPQGYENLSLNMRELKRYIEQQKEIIIYYRRVSNQLELILENPERREEFLDDLS